MIKKAIDLGVAKINVNTECQLVFAEATRKYIEAGKDLEGKGYDPRKLLKPGAEAIIDKVKEKMELFGSVGKSLSIRHRDKKNKGVPTGSWSAFF